MQLETTAKTPIIANTGKPGVRYYSKIAGSRFIFTDGHEIWFNHGFHDLMPETYKDEVYMVPEENQHRIYNGRDKYTIYKMELDAILGKNPVIYIPAILPVETKITGTIPQAGFDGRTYDRPADAGANALSTMELQTGEARLAGVRTRVAQEVEVPGTGMPSAPGQGTVDPDILAAQIAANSVPVGGDLPQMPQVGPGAERVARMRQEAAQRTAQVNRVEGEP